MIRLPQFAGTVGHCGRTGTPGWQTFLMADAEFDYVLTEDDWVLLGPSLERAVIYNKETRMALVVEDDQAASDLKSALLKLGRPLLERIPDNS